MKTSFLSPFTAVLCIGLFTSIASAAPKSHVKEKGVIHIDVPLTAQAGAPVGVTGSGEITITKGKFKEGEAAKLELTIAGLPVGSYAVDATLSTSATPAHLGDFEVAAAGAGSSSIELAIPSTVDAGAIVSLTVTNSGTATVILAGEAGAPSVDWKYIANVRIEAVEIQNENAHPVGGGGGIKKVSGHVISHSFIKNSVEKQRLFLWVGFGAPKDTVLTINVDGVAVGTVTSSNSGKVFFEGLPETVVIRNIKLVKLTDPQGAGVMQAKFVE